MLSKTVFIFTFFAQFSSFISFHTLWAFRSHCKLLFIVQGKTFLPTFFLFLPLNAPAVLCFFICTQFQSCPCFLLFLYCFFPSVKNSFPNQPSLYSFSQYLYCTYLNSNTLFDRYKLNAPIPTRSLFPQRNFPLFLCGCYIFLDHLASLVDNFNFELH